MHQIQHGPSLDGDVSPSSPESPEFGKVHVVITPPSDAPSIPTPEFGQSNSKKLTEATRPVDSPKFGFAVPASPSFGQPDADATDVQSPESPEWPAPSPDRESQPVKRQPTTLQEPEDERHGEPHPSTPDFGSLNNAPRLDDICKLSSAASSPQGSSHENSPENASDKAKRLSVDMLLPSPASPNGVSKESTRPGESGNAGQKDSYAGKFDFHDVQEKDDAGKNTEEDGENEKEELLQECIYMQQELKRREEMLNWFYEELEATSAELKELQENQSSRSELHEELEEAAANEQNLEMKLKRLHSQMQEQSLQALEDKLHEAKQLQQEEAVTKTLRLENDDLASELRDLYEKLAEAQGAKQEAALEDALARAEAEALGRASALKGEDSDLAEKLAQTQEQLKQSRLDSAQKAAKIQELEAQRGKLQDTTRDLEAKLASAVAAGEDSDAQANLSQQSSAKLREEVRSVKDELHTTQVELVNCKQLAGKRAIETEAASEVEAKMMKLQKFSEKLQEEMADEMKLATGHKALVGTLEMELEVERQGRASAQEAFGKVKATANSLECQLASECATAERLKAHGNEEQQSHAKSAAALSVAKAEQASGGLEMEELREELQLARQQRRAAMQASERAQMARLKQKQQLETVEAQAVSWRKQSELEEAARSASLASLIEEHGALVREQHAELLDEVRECNAMVARRTAELSESQEESSKLKLQIGHLEQEAHAAQKLVESEQRSCSLLLQQLEEVTVQSIEAAAEHQPQVPLSRAEVAQAFQLRDELAALQVRQLQVEAAAVRRQLQEVHGATHVAGSLSGGDSSTFDYDTPMRRIVAAQRGQVSALPLSASVGSPSPMSSLQAHVGSQWMLPWGPPPAKAKDLLFSPTSSPASSSRPPDVQRKVSHVG